VNSLNLPQDIVNCATVGNFKRKWSCIDLSRFVVFKKIVFSIPTGEWSLVRPHSPLAFRLCTFLAWFSTWFATSQWIPLPLDSMRAAMLTVTLRRSLPRPTSPRHDDDDDDESVDTFATGLHASCHVDSVSEQAVARHDETNDTRHHRAAVQTCVHTGV